MAAASTDAPNADLSAQVAVAPAERGTRRTSRAMQVATGFCAVTGVALLALNLYGVLFQSLRHPALAAETEMRFQDDLRLSLDDARAQLVRRADESPRDYALRANQVVQRGLAHVEWESDAATKYYQRVPVWENYVLWGLSYVAPGDFRRYHFTNAERTLERGIGVCGDAACLLSSVLAREGIEARVVAFADHVVVAADLGAGEQEWWMLDPDFGVAIAGEMETLAKEPERVREAYSAAGYSDIDAAALAFYFAGERKTFASAFDFSPNHARFESAAYVLKWAFPLGLLGLVLIAWRRGRPR